MKSTALGAENIIFISDAHEKFYYEKLQEVRYQDVYHKALCYCLGINGDTRKNADRIYNFKTGSVKTKCLHEGWQTSGSLKVVRMAFNLYCNPFVYIRSEKDILKLVTTIIANTKGEGQQSGEDFWVKAEKLYYCALIGYIWYEGREEEKNFNTLLAMINASEAREDDENFKNPVDLMFDDLEQKDPNHFAVRQYKKYKLAAGDICSK